MRFLWCSGGLIYELEGEGFMKLKKIRNESERQQFLKEQDGWTEFKIETVTMFGFPVVMSECVKCGNIVPLYNLFRCLLPLHCTCCGRTTLEQDRAMYKNLLENPNGEKQCV